MIENEPRVERKEARIAAHLRAIDPVLVPLAGKLAKPPYKDLSTPEAFHFGTETLEAKDLVAVHLTDTFPENGVIHPTNYYDPKALRFTTHFSINAVAPEIWTGWNWKQRKYAVLIPFDKLQGRILAFNPADTFVLEDINLPDGTVILKDKTDDTSPQKAGMAQVVEVDYSQEGERINGFHRAVYEQMVSMGYFPQAVGERGDYYGWNLGLPYGGEISGRDILEKFCERTGLEFAKGNPHESHWAGKLEEISEGLEFAREDNNEGGFRQTVDTANRLFLSEDSQFGNQVPRKYKEALIELIKDYQQTFNAEIELPDLPPDEASEKAKTKIVDLSKDKEHLVHVTSVEMLPIILEDGIISHRFAARGLRYTGLPSHLSPIVQARIENYMDEETKGTLGITSAYDLISVSNLRTGAYGRETVLDLVSRKIAPKEEIFRGPVFLLISGRVADRIVDVPRRWLTGMESLIKRRVAPRDLDGVVVQSYCFREPVSELVQRILFEADYPLARADESEQIRERFMIKHSKNSELQDLFQRIKTNQIELEETWTDFMNLFGFQQNNPYKLDSWHDGLNFPRAFWNFNGGISFNKPNNRVRLYINSERQDGLQELEQYINDIKKKIATLVQEKGTITFGDMVKMFGMGTGVPPEKQPQSTRKGLFGLFRKLEPPPEETHPLEREAPVNEIVTLMEKILGARKIRAELNPAVWRRYIEQIAGKKIDSATLGDFVLGLCRQKGLPVYNEKGEILWPK